MEKLNKTFQANGIVAEYNPFHNGHKYQMENAKSQTGADFTVVVMSGNFMQRGTPAIIGKYSRAEIALKNGADLVVELPVFYAASSAEYFATGAVSLLDKLGVVDNLCFGSECGDLSILQRIADILLDEPAKYTTSLKENLREGYSYPLARTNALLEFDPSLNSYREVLSSANNILGIEYLKALKRLSSSMKPVTTLRTSSNYHDRMLGVHQSSALAIRQAIYDGQEPKQLAGQIPDEALEIFSDTLAKHGTMELNNFSAALHYKLLLEKNQGYTRYLDVSEELSDRIRNHVEEFRSFRDFCDLLKTKEMTYTRISRCLLHILLGLEKSEMGVEQKKDYITYARVLGFRKTAEPLLTAIKANSSIPMLTKLADAEKILDKESFDTLQRELCINSIYYGTSALKSGQPMINEYRMPLVVL